jgi:chemotaxis protein methyltransferase CheR
MPAELSAQDAEFVRDLVYRKAAITLDESKNYLITNRLAGLVRESWQGDMAALVKAARDGRADVHTLIVEAMTTHETYFFRDIIPFDAMRTQVLPELAVARPYPRSVNVWSAASSTGQEAYSLAMTVLEHFPELARRFRVIGTDISGPILDRARSGIFNQMEVNRGLPARLLVKYFEADGRQWTIKPEVRALTEFKQLNLLDLWVGLPQPDVVFLRNVLIYFDIPTRKKILDRIYRLLPPDGVLFVGSAESLVSVDDRWVLAPAGRGTHYRKAQ